MKKWTTAYPSTGHVSAEEDAGGKGWDYKTVSIKNEAGNTICTVQGYDTENFIKPDEVDRYVNLILAAPALLESLERLIDCIRENSSESASYSAFFGAVAAIEKAKSKQAAVEPVSNPILYEPETLGLW